MEIKSKVAASVFAALLFGGVMDTADALRIAEGIEVRADHKPYYTEDYGDPLKAGQAVLGGEEAKLFTVLHEKGIDILNDRNLSVPEISGLPKYMAELLVALNSNVPPIHIDDLQKETNPFEVRRVIKGLVIKIAKKYAHHKSQKAEEVRSVIDDSTSCLQVLNQTIGETMFGAKELEPDKVANVFKNSLLRLNTAITDVKQKIAESKTIQDGGSSNSLKKLLNEMLKIKNSISKLAIVLFQRLQAEQNSSAAMELFHHAYRGLCAGGEGGDEWFADNAYGKYDPPTSKNGNKTLLDRYKSWLDEKGERMPQPNFSNDNVGL